MSRPFAGRMSFSIENDSNMFCNEVTVFSGAGRWTRCTGISRRGGATMGERARESRVYAYLRPNFESNGSVRPIAVIAARVHSPVLCDRMAKSFPSR